LDQSRKEVIPLSTIEKAPSAELRPDQKDEDSLPPYDILDRILKAYIEDLRSPQEIADKYGFDLKLVRDIALLVDRNEYKRKQAAPGLKITSRAFGFGRPFLLRSGLFRKRGHIENKNLRGDGRYLGSGELGHWTRARTGGAKLDGQASSSWLSSSDTVAKRLWRPTCAISMPLVLTCCLRFQCPRIAKSLACWKPRST